MRKVLPNELTVSIALMLAMVCSGCSTAWIVTLDSILAAAAPALVNILQIVAVAQGVPLNTSLVTKINSDAAVLKTLAADFAKASSGATPGVCQQLQAAIGVYAGDQELVLQAAQVSDPRTQTKITGLVDLVAGTVTAISAAIPSCKNVAAPSVQSLASPFHVNSFVQDYNKVLVARTGNDAVDAVTPELTLHRHSPIIRIATFGKLR